MCQLSVNVNKIATLRNSRGGDVPNVVQVASDIIRFGAQGITVHPRPDGRHIRTKDVYDLSRLIRKINRKRKHKIEFNIEGYPSRSFLKMIDKVRPDQATLVPDPPHVITSNAGWRLAKNKNSLIRIVKSLRKMNVRSSLFVDVYSWGKEEEAALKKIQPDRIELYTEKFAKDYVTKKRQRTVQQYRKVASFAESICVATNAGHDLNLQNVRYLIKNVPQVLECSIGHALISEALYLGLEKTVKSYLRQMK
jgi:pyridoxine 5-phosphate synthase